jgi:hypothetical protein
MQGRKKRKFACKCKQSSETFIKTQPSEARRNSDVAAFRRTPPTATRLTDRNPPPSSPTRAGSSATKLDAFERITKAFPKDGIEAYRDVYSEVVWEIGARLTTTAQYRRPARSRQSHPFLQQSMPEIRRDKFTEGEILEKSDFVAAAITRESPLDEADRDVAEALDDDLKIAIEVVHRRGKKIVRDRQVRLQELSVLSGKLEPLRNRLDALKCATAKEIASDFNVAWTAAVVDAMDWPDKDLALRYMIGFDVVFDIPDSGVFREEEQSESISKADFKAANSRVVTTLTDEIARSATSGNEEDVERRKQCWVRTKEEIDEGLVRGPYSRARMDRKYGRGKWRCLGRNAIKQKGKWRCIDNGKRSKHNRATRMHERITCGRADFPIMIAREFARRVAARTKARQNTRGIKRLRMKHGTNDLRAAYRHVPTSQPQYTCVAVWNADHKKVVYCDVPGHNFGLKSAVVNFNRFPELATIAARRLLWCVSEHYYDDNSTAEPALGGTSGQDALVAICSKDFFGFPFDPNKDEEMKERNEYLGVQSDLSKVRQGVLIMDVSAKRRKKIAELIDEVDRAEKLRSGLAASIFGKARWMLSPCYGTLGKACLQPIMDREYQPRMSELTDDLRDSLEFIRFLCDELPPMELPLLPSRKEKVVIFTDAEGKKRSGRKLPTGHLGFTVIHPEHGKVYATAPVPVRWVRLFDSIKERETYIGQFELAAAITPFLSLPAEWFKDRPIELWIDNSGAIGGLIKGYSGVPDCAKIVNMFHFTMAKLGVASLWIDYVPSESNPADIPSRLHEMSEKEAEREVADLGTLVEMTIPEFADENGRWLSSIDIARSAWR